ncbi:MAG TPA: AAA domain-containing protein [Micromonosporaceae bacterium]|nr:AAA domain-containing protein [Micromonosporaceae bacterium]
MAATRSMDRELIATTSSLVEFLRDVALARRRRITDVSEYETVLWLDDLPNEVTVDVEAGPGETLLAVPRLRGEAPPEPPAVLTNWIDKESLADSSAPSPLLKDQGPAWVIVEQPDGSKGMTAKVVSRDEAPDVGRAFESWLPQWRAWAKRDQRSAPFRRWYTSLAAAAQLVSQQDDQYELVLATGLLAWRAPSGTVIRNHILTSRLLAVLDTDKDEIRVIVDPEGGTRTQDRELLDGEDGFDASRVESMHDKVREDAVVAPLVDCEPLAKSWAERALDAETPFIADWTPVDEPDVNPEVRFAPAIILRKRERASLIGYYDAMLQALRGPNARAPLGLAQLVTSMETSERLAWLAENQSGDADATGATGDGVAERPGPEMLGDDPLFPLPANPEQMRIIERLRGNNGVVVQGPPGTGKTHTIANLISALLAEGQRVLVTSQKAQALRVLRDKLPDEVARLCVSITDLERGGSAELEGSVKAMSNRYANFDPKAHADEVARSAQRRAELLAKVESLTDQVRALRETETHVHPAVAPGYEGTLGEIARRLRAAAPRCDWMPVPVPDAAEINAGFTAADAAELVRLLAAQTPQRKARLKQRAVDVSAYPTDGQVRAMIAAEQNAREVAERGSTEVSRRLDGCDAAVLDGLRSEVESARQLASLLGLPAEPHRWDTADFAVRGIVDGLNGHNSTLWAQLAAGFDQIKAAEEAVRVLGFRQVIIGAGAPGTATARLAKVTPLKQHLAEGGKLRSAFKSSVQREAEEVLQHATVDGLPVTTPEHVNLVHAVLEAQACVENLGRGWSMVGAAVVGPVDEPVQQAIARVIDAYKRLDLVQRFLDVVGRIRATLLATQSWLPLTSLAEWEEFVDALGAVQLRVKADEATAALEALRERLAKDAEAADSPPELDDAATAIAERNADAYEAAMAALSRVDQERADQVACDKALKRLRQVHPALATLLERTATDEVWSSRLADWDAAWAWGRANTFFINQRRPGLEQQLEAELNDTILRLRQETAELAALRAWGHCLSRMTAHQAQALQAYEQHMRSVGKGTGRYASKYRKLAREAMQQARAAVPAWIMPLDVVLETLPPVRDSFDVVIVDEASQASLEDLFLLWLAPRVIVVGDDKQCAPSQVRLGELEPIFAKLTSYLPELPAYLRDAYTPKSSLFDLLRTRFGAVIGLREHFRCMPEIIEYSSRQFYADEPLVPLRQFGGDRLPPLRAVRVEGAKTQGTSTRLRNQREAEAIVDQIQACLADPAYDGKTIGVIVLQGTGQVQLLHKMLMEKVEPKQWQARRLRVGTPPDFQGDERDVVFISMVIAEKRAAVTGTEWQRRFNVAASRAKDQMWLFHSVGPEDLSTNDLRFSLLSYVLNPPPAVPVELPADVRPDEPHPAFRSLFHQRVFLHIRDRGFHVVPGVEVNGRDIDLVITGARGRLAVECDGSDWVGTPEQREADLDRERELKRAGWRFWRVRESEFQYDPDAALATLWETLERYDIRPYDPSELAATVSNASVWRPAELSTLEGLDGLEGAAPEELDDVHLA